MGKGQPVPKSVHISPGAVRLHHKWSVVKDEKALQVRARMYTNPKSNLEIEYSPTGKPIAIRRH